MTESKKIGLISCVDTSIPKECVFQHHTLLDDNAVSELSSSSFPSSRGPLPEPVQVIPSHVKDLKMCAEWQIKCLEQESVRIKDDCTDVHSSCSSCSNDIEDALDDGFVMCDMNVVAQKLVAWRHLFPRIKPFYALKCNPDPMVAAVLGLTNQAAGFDCASVSEITLALQSTTTPSCHPNGNPHLIVYANPQRAEHDLEQSLRLGISAFTFDGEEELHKIFRAYQKYKQVQKKSLSAIPPRQPEMIVRLLVPDEGSTVPLGEKFGAPPILHRIQQLTELAMQLQLPIIGVSFHCGSGCHDPLAYTNAIRLAKEAMDMIDSIQMAAVPTANAKKCWLLDIGGGFPGRDGWTGECERFSGVGTALSNTKQQPEIDETLETAAKIANVINPLLNELLPNQGSTGGHDDTYGHSQRQVQIISEPGRYFVEAAFTLCSRIYRTEKRQDAEGLECMHYTIAQGVQGVFKDVLLCGEEFCPVPLRLSQPASSSSTALMPSVVHGPSGKDYDIVSKTDLPLLQVGDWLLFDRMGAYTLSISARSGRPPIRYLLGGTTQ